MTKFVPVVVDRKVTHVGEQVTQLQGRVDEIHAVVVARKRGRQIAAARVGAVVLLQEASSNPMATLVESISFSRVNTVWEAVEEWTTGLNGFPAISEIPARPLGEGVRFSGPAQTALSKRRYSFIPLFISWCSIL